MVIGFLILSFVIMALAFLVGYLRGKNINTFFIPKNDRKKVKEPKSDPVTNPAPVSNTEKPRTYVKREPEYHYYPPNDEYERYSVSSSKSSHPVLPTPPSPRRSIKEPAKILQLSASPKKKSCPKEA